MSLTEGSTLYHLWQKPPVNVYIKVEILENTNVTFNPNDTVTYIPKRRVQAEPEISPRDAHAERIIVPNVALLGMASMLHNSSLLLNAGLAALARYLDSQPFLNLTAHEYLWGYDDPLVRLASTVLPNWIPFSRLGLMDRMFDEGENVITVALNGGQAAETEAMERRRRIYSIDSYNGWTALRQWTGETSCSSLKGVSEGVLYPKRMRSNDTFLIYRKAFCRVLPVAFSRSGVTNEGFPAYWFHLPDNVFDSPDRNPENACYCRPKVAPCLLSGLADLTPCYYGIPVALSFPHFLKGDPRLLDKMDGLSPDPSKHESIIVIQPDLGLPLTVRSRMQLNLAVHNTRLQSQVARFNNHTLPIFWLDWYFDMPDEVSRLMHLVLFVAPALQSTAIVLLALLGIAMLGLATCSCSKKNTLFDTLLIPINAINLEIICNRPERYDHSINRGTSMTKPYLTSRQIRKHSSTHETSG
ncbi:hypothetical protein Cfor_05572 [Coptotermes formosanus]|uniref:Scavenger receptor class B member 1 n=1 Tax=Coptotermes formosanus TaxID=36987 RepID=A0A6L2PNZ6_COPFO|nr:hypothetical protein Cfor_05572 [Coptotermes formosanus]